MNDNLETELHAAIRSQAESVSPADRLGTIRAGTRGESAPARTSWWNQPWMLAAGTGLIAASVITAAVVLATQSSDAPIAAGDQREVTVYEIGGVGQLKTWRVNDIPARLHWWLYPKQVMTEDTGDPALDAVRAIQEQETGEQKVPECGIDPLSVERRGGVVAVQFASAISGDYCDSEATGFTARQQQLAWTVRSAIGWEGEVVSTVDGQPLNQAASADPSALSPILIDLPSDGDTAASPVTVAGTSDTFEANVLWEVRQDGEVVKDGFTMGGTMGERAPFEFIVDLPPGDYTALAYAESAEDGTLFAKDTVTFTVE